MSYLLDKRKKRKKFLKLLGLVLALVIFIYFQNPIFRGLSYAAQIVFRPFLSAGESVGGKFFSCGGYFQFKKSLQRENENLKLKLSEMEAQIANWGILSDENIKLKEIFGRSENRELILAAILAKPDRSPYDTLILDVGSEEGIEARSIVYAFGNIPIGKVSDVYPGSSKAILFSNPGEKTEVLVSLGRSPSGEAGKDIFMQVVGRGGGNFEMTLPRDLVLEKGTEVQLPGLAPRALAIVETILSDPRDAFQKALLVSPVNIQELKFVEIEK